MKKILFILIMCPLFCFSQVEWGKLSHKKREFLKTHLSLARWIECKYQVPKEVTLAVAALESAWGEDKVAISQNNYFGIYVPGRKTHQYFCAIQECYRYFGVLLSSGERYKLLASTKDYRNYCRVLQASGYNGREGYADYLIRIIEQNDFHKIP